jgi:hypothetical protein
VRCKIPRNQLPPETFFQASNAEIETTIHLRHPSGAPDLSANHVVLLVPFCGRRIRTAVLAKGFAEFIQLGVRQTVEIFTGPNFWFSWH